MFLLDPAVRIVFWSAGAEQIFLWTKEEAVGKPGEIVFTPEDRAAGAPEDEMRRALAEGRALDRRWHQRKDGSRLWADGIMTALPQGGFAKIMRDATEQRQAEDQIRDTNEALERTNEALQRANGALETLNQTLELRVQERTRELVTMAEARQELLRELVTVQEEERARIARELHDQFGQQVTGFLLAAEALRARLPAGSEDVAQAERMREAAAELSRQVHRLAWELRPPVLDDLGLEATLSSFAQEWGQRNGIPVDVHVQGCGPEKRLPREVETALYRIVQEALTNVARHAPSASRVGIVLEQRGGESLLVVEDDGPGFDVEATLLDSRRLGIRGMRERAMLMEGSLKIESTPGEGATVFARIPVVPAAAAALAEGGWR